VFVDGYLLIPFTVCGALEVGASPSLASRRAPESFQIRALE